MTEKIRGYRELSPFELQLINMVKDLGENIELLVGTLRAEQDVDQRWVSIGKIDLQTGLMALTRAIAQPETF